MLSVGVWMLTKVEQIVTVPHIDSLFRAETYRGTLIAHQKLGQSELLCRSKSPAEKSGRE